MRFDREGIQREVADAAREFLSGAWSLEQLRETPTRGLPADVWAELEGLGWFELIIPEASDGLGLGPIEAGAIFEEAGRALLPGPLLENVVVMPLCRAEGIESHGLASYACHDARPNGDGRVTVADGELAGTKTLVESADAADTLIVLAESEQGQVVAAIAARGGGTEIRPMESVDLAGRPHEVFVTGAPVTGLVEDATASALAHRIDEWALVMTTSRMLGVIDRILEMSVEYAKERHQFGRSIGSFQAVQHRLADMATLAIAGRHVCYVSQWALATNAADRDRRARVAKAYVSRAARRVAEGAIQVHGGIGFSEEHDLHLFVKHALALEGTWGDADVHEDALAAALVDASAAGRPGREEPTPTKEAS